MGHTKFNDASAGSQMFTRNFPDSPKYIGKISSLCVALYYIVQSQIEIQNQDLSRGEKWCMAGALGLQIQWGMPTNFAKGEFGPN